MGTVSRAGALAAAVRAFDAALGEVPGAPNTQQRLMALSAALEAYEAVGMEAAARICERLAESAPTEDTDADACRACAEAIRAATQQAAREQQEPVACTCPSGDGSLRWPCPAHPPGFAEEDREIVRSALGFAYECKPSARIARLEKLYAAPVAQQSEAATVDDLAALVQRLVRALKAASPGSELPAAAMDYLRRKGLQGSPLRATPTSGRESAAPVAQQDARDAALYRAVRGGFWNDKQLVVIKAEDLPLGVQTYSGDLLDDAIRVRTP